MKRLGMWILGTALGSFAAGMNVGLIAPELFADVGPGALADDAAYVRKIVADYDLSGAQETSLRLVLQKWREEEVMALRTAEISMLPTTIQQELLKARGRAEERIRAILDEDQRARYDLATRPQGR